MHCLRCWLFYYFHHLPINQYAFLRIKYLQYLTRHPHERWCTLLYNSLSSPPVIPSVISYHCPCSDMYFVILLKLKHSFVCFFIFSCLSNGNLCLVLQGCSFSKTYLAKTTKESINILSSCVLHIFCKFCILSQLTLKKFMCMSKSLKSTCSSQKRFFLDQFCKISWRLFLKWGMGLSHGFINDSGSLVLNLSKSFHRSY